MIVHRILHADLPAWEALGWALAGGTPCQSVGGHVALVEWMSDGEPQLPLGGRGDMVAAGYEQGARDMALFLVGLGERPVSVDRAVADFLAQRRAR